LLAKLTAALAAFGPWGVVLLAFIDSAGIPIAMGMDALVVFVAVTAPEKAYLTALLAVLGSAVGNLTLFIASRKGAQRITRSREAEKPGRFREWFERYGLLTVFVPALSPIPMPLKFFVVSAGAMRTSPIAFMAVILLARVLRYFGEAWLGIRLGQDANAFLLRNAWPLTGAVLALAFVLYLIARFMARDGKSAA
jgi:membrane protein YqaA with SNARE-associated domain